MELIKLSFAISIIAFTYSVVLTEPGMLLEKIAAWLAYFLPEWLFMPLIGCERCVAGQMALWYYLLSHVHISDYWHELFLGAKTKFIIVDYSLKGHLFVVCLSIFIVTFIKPIYSWMQRF